MLTAQLSNSWHVQYKPLLIQALCNPVVKNLAIRYHQIEVFRADKKCDIPACKTWDVVHSRAFQKNLSEEGPVRLQQKWMQNTLN